MTAALGTPRDLDWSEEPRVQIPTRDTAAWQALGWQAQAVYLAVQRKLDPAGVLDCAGADPVTAVAGVLAGWPLEVVAAGLEQLGAAGWIVYHAAEGALVDPSHAAAQDAPRSNALRCRESRRRRQAMARAAERGFLGGEVEATPIVSPVTQNASPPPVPPTMTRNASLFDPPRPAAATQNASQPGDPPPDSATRNASRPTRNASPPTQNVSSATQNASGVPPSPPNLPFPLPGEEGLLIFPFKDQEPPLGGSGEGGGRAHARAREATRIASPPTRNASPEPGAGRPPTRNASPPTRSASPPPGPTPPPGRAGRSRRRGGRVELPAELTAAISDFPELWAERLRNADRRRPSRPAEARQLADLVELLRSDGPDAVRKCVDHAARGGYQGIFPERFRKSETPVRGGPRVPARTTAEDRERRRRRIRRNV